MFDDLTMLTIWLGVFGVVVGLGIYGIMLLRRWLLEEDEDTSQQADSIYTTAQVEKMLEEGLIDRRQYEKLIKKVREASARRAEASKRRKSTRDSGLFR